MKTMTYRYVQQHRRVIQDALHGAFGYSPEANKIYIDSITKDNFLTIIIFLLGTIEYRLEIWSDWEDHIYQYELSILDQDRKTTFKIKTDHEWSEFNRKGET